VEADHNAEVLAEGRGGRYSRESNKKVIEGPFGMKKIRGGKAEKVGFRVKKRGLIPQIF